MGLPIWRDPEEEKKSTKTQSKNDPTADSRSPIRRRPSVHGRRDGRPRIPREQSFHSNTPPQAGTTSSRFRNMRNQSRVMPPMSTLFESASHNAPLPPPPAPESRNYARDRGLRSDEDIMRGMARRGGQAAPDFPSPPQDYSSWPRSVRRAWMDERVASASLRRRGELTSNAAQAAEPQRFLDVTGNRARLFRSPEPLLDVDSATGWNQRPPSVPPLSTLPTPPHDQSMEAEDLSLSGTNPRQPGVIRRSHPLSNSWRPESPVNGLGDRNRSPTPGDGWEMMRATIMPDATLPSADSSFTSAVASNSFSSSNDDTTITAPTDSDTEHNHRRRLSNSSSVSSVDPDDLICADEDMINATEAFAEDMYLHEQTYPEGRQRIYELEQRRAAEGNRFALEHEPMLIDIGFRLIEAALDTEDGRRRLMQVRNNISSDEVRDVTRERENVVGRRRTRALHLLDDNAPSTGTRALTPSLTTRDRRPESPAVSDSEIEDEMRAYRELVRLGDLPANEWSRPYHIVEESTMSLSSVSVDGPLPHPVSPPTRRNEAAVYGSNGQDPERMRRVVERLALRGDLPQDWWHTRDLARLIELERRPQGMATTGNRTGRRLNSPHSRPDETE